MTAVATIITEEDAQAAFITLQRDLASTPLQLRRSAFLDGVGNIFRAGSLGKGYVAERAQEIADAFGLFGEEFQDELAAVLSPGSQAVNGADHREPPKEATEPLPLISVASFEGKDIPPREWLAHHRIPVGKPVLLSGDGAAGKTTIATQLGVATVRGTDWLGSVIERRGSVLLATAEEDEPEMHYRIAAVAKHFSIGLSELADLHLLCLPGDACILAQPDRQNVMQPTPLFLRIEKTILQLGPVLVILEAAADLFACDENNRNHARQSIGFLRRLCSLPSRPSVVLLAHPSLSGLNSGRGTSGSTGWHNSVRARLYLSAAKTDDHDLDQDDTAARILEVKKSNYGPDGEKVRLRWQDGVFIPHGAVSSLAQVAAEARADETFLCCLDAAAAQGITASPLNGKNSAWKVFADMPEAKGLKARALEMAMRRLLSANKITSIKIGPKSRQKDSLVRAEVQT